MFNVVTCHSHFTAALCPELDILLCLSQSIDCGKVLVKVQGLDCCGMRFFDSLQWRNSSNMPLGYLYDRYLGKKDFLGRVSSVSPKKYST